MLPFPVRERFANPYAILGKAAVPEGSLAAPRWKYSFALLTYDSYVPFRTIGLLGGIGKLTAELGCFALVIILFRVPYPVFTVVFLF